MSMAISFLIGGMLGRIAGPIAQDWFEYKTSLGKDIAQRKLDKQRQLSQIEFDNKVRLSKQEHQRKLDEMLAQFDLNRQKAEEQMLLSYSEWQQKTFWEKCFPLRNPFEVPLGYEPIFEGSTNRLERCKLTTVMLPNNRQVVPLRVITALKDNVHNHAFTVNSNLSMFLVNNYSANSEHAVISDIGAWKDDAPVNDASINYLFKGLKGQPAIVLVPAYTNGGSLVRLKIWSWGLGEQLQYPVGIDFGWFDLDILYRHALVGEIKSFNSTLEKIGATLPNKELERDLKILSMIENKKDVLSEEEINRLYTLLSIPNEIKDSLQRRTNELASTIYSCATAMYADGYHLHEYGTLPRLPYLLPQMSGAKMLLPYIRDYYMSLSNVALIKGILKPADAANIELDLLDCFKYMGATDDTKKSLVENVRSLIFDIKGQMLDTPKSIELLENRSKLM